MRKLKLADVMVQRGLAKDLKAATAMVLAGQVLSGDTLLEKPGQSVDAAIVLRLRGQKAYASRAGGKLEAALSQGHIDVTGLICLDLGASTGGFTHCLLQHGVAKVYAVEKGHRQLAYALTEDHPRHQLGRQWTLWR